MAKKFNMWIDDDDLEIIRKKAKKENRSVANFFKTKALGEKKNDK